MDRHVCKTMLAVANTRPAFLTAFYKKYRRILVRMVAVLIVRDENDGFFVPCRRRRVNGGRGGGCVITATAATGKDITYFRSEDKSSMSSIAAHMGAGGTSESSLNGGTVFICDTVKTGMDPKERCRTTTVAWKQEGQGRGRFRTSEKWGLQL